MERAAIRSRDIAIVGYDEQSLTLEVTFRSGGVYKYCEVPTQVHENLMKATSRGTYFRDHIRDSFAYQKVS